MGARWRIRTFRGCQRLNRPERLKIGLPRRSQLRLARQARIVHSGLAGVKMPSCNNGLRRVDGWFNSPSRRKGRGMASRGGACATMAARRRLGPVGKHGARPAHHNDLMAACSGPKITTRTAVTMDVSLFSPRRWAGSSRPCHEPRRPSGPLHCGSFPPCKPPRRDGHLRSRVRGCFLTGHHKRADRGAWAHRLGTSMDIGSLRGSRFY